MFFPRAAVGEALSFAINLCTAGYWTLWSVAKDEIEPKGRAQVKCSAALQGSVPMLGWSPEGQCLIFHGNCVGVHTRGRATLRCARAGHSWSPSMCPKGEWWLQQGVTGKCVCSVVPITPAPTGRICWWRGGWELHLLRVIAAALLHLCVWEPEKGHSPRGSNICPVLLLDPCTSSVLNSVKSYVET